MIKNILLKSGEDTNSAQEEFNALKEGARSGGKAKTVKNGSPDTLKKVLREKNLNNIMEKENDSKKVIVVGVLAFLIGFGLGFLVFDADTEELENEAEDLMENVEDALTGESVTNDTSETEVLPAVVSGVSLAVSDQNFGSSVSVDSVTLDRTSWIVVYEDNAGVPGSILGAKLHDAGSMDDASVTLLRATVPEQLYYVKIHADDGDRAFDFKKDVAVVDESGVEIVSTFTTGGGTPR